MKLGLTQYEINNLIKLYRKGYAGIVELIQPLSEFIYYYPKAVFNAEEDVCSDFYEYIYERLDVIQQKYDPEQSHFQTFLSVILRNYYMNFLASSERKEFYKHENIITDPAIVEMIQSPKETISHLEEHLEFRKLILSVIDSFKDKEWMVAKLYFYDYVTPTDLKEIARLTGKKLSTCLHEWKNIMLENGEYVKKKLRIKMLVHHYRDKKLKLEYRLSEIVKFMEKVEDEEYLRELTLDRDQTIKRLKKCITRMTKYSKDYTASVYTTGRQILADFLKIPRGTIDRILHKVRAELMQQIQIEEWRWEK